MKENVLHLFVCLHHSTSYAQSQKHQAHRSSWSGCPFSGSRFEPGT